MQEEIDALRSNNTWDLVACPSNTNAVGSKWVFRTKFCSDGTIERHQAHLGAQGFTQITGTDFNQTFTPVIKAATVCVILAFSVQNKQPLHQLDVKNAFLNGILEKTVFMAQPSSFVDPKFPNPVCCLKKVIYGLCQDPLAWYQRFSSFLLSLDF